MSVQLAQRERHWVGRSAVHWRRFRLLLIGGCLVGLVVLSAIFADVISPYSPYDIDVAIKLQPPNRAHWLGTDEFGRDVLSRVIHAARISVKVAAVAVSVGLIGGGVIGIAAGYFGGPVDMVLMRFMELLFSFQGFHGWPEPRPKMSCGSSTLRPPTPSACRTSAF